ncbi:hypothetical protein PLICRDRAFT_165360 [Plicaturopsis crispa FD-325 SS-3]|nr:hypothetical protein PLICRDRAFT_165360 [Plicaturopsis crispa FD-325 SS-3]
MRVLSRRRLSSCSGMSPEDQQLRSLAHPAQVDTDAQFDPARLGEHWREATSSKGHRFSLFNQEIEQSPNDDRQYRLVVLRNGLEVLLVSDAQTDKAAACLSVGVGHLNDPDDLPGLAHFCEHMLFLGTEKFPDESEYKRYLSQHSGSSNASTAMYITQYHFDVHPSGLAGALARHAQFFTAPLFAASCTSREVNAVNSEFQRNLQLDSRRFFQLAKATSNRAPGSVYWKFSTGSKESLWDEPVANGVDVRARLLTWYKSNYSANLMKLVILGNQPLDELENLAITEYSDVPNSNLMPATYDVPPLTPDELMTEISFRTVKDTPQLYVEFPFPDQRLKEHLFTKPGKFIAHFLGHEGHGSCLAILKKQGWVTDLSAYDTHGPPGSDFFRVTCQMTAAGLDHYRDVVKTIFAYLDILRSTTPQEWAFHEIQALGKIAWRFQEKGQPRPTVQALASQLQTLYPRDKILVGRWFADRFDADLIQKCLHALTAENCRIFVGSPKPLAGKDYWPLKEKYYSTEYALEKFDEDYCKPSSEHKKHLALPDRNPFIPQDLEIRDKTIPNEPSKRPYLIQRTSKSCLWHKKDDTFFVPRASLHILLRTPLADKTALLAVKTRVLTELVTETLSEYAYDAYLAGLGYSIDVGVDGVQLTVTGYNDKLAVLLKIVVETLRNLQVDASRFELVHDRLTRSYANTKKDNPYMTADTLLRHLTRQTHWTYDELLRALKGLKPSDIQGHIEPLLREVRVDMLVHGNVLRDEALTMLTLVESILKSESLDPSQLDFHRGLLLPSGSNTIYRPHVPSEENVNSAASVYFQVCETSNHNLYARLALFAQIAKEPIFSTLRTREQLGYIVSSGVWSARGVAGFRVVVQSERPAEVLEERIESLWKESFDKYLADMSDEEFEKQKQSLIVKRLEKPKNLYQEASRYWSEISSGELDFFYRERDVSIFASLRKQDISEFWSKYICHSPERAKVSALMRSQRLQPDAMSPLLAILARHGCDAAHTELDTFGKTKPTVEQLRTFVHKLRCSAQSPALREELDNAIESMAKPVPLDRGVEEISEPEAFRTTLKKANAVKPAGDFEEDLLVHSLARASL